MTSELEAMNSKCRLKLAHHSNVGDSLASGSGKLNGGNKNIEDSLERDEAAHSHSPDVKMKAPMKSMKLVLKKKQISADTKSPCRLKFVSSKVDSTVARGDVNSGDSSFMSTNLGTEVPREGDNNEKISSQLLSRSYTNKKKYDQTQQRDRSFKGEINPDAGTDMEENTSIVNNHPDLGLHQCDAVSDPIRRARSIRLKNEQPNGMNLRIKIRGGQNLRGTLDQAESSIKVSDQLERRSRPARNKQGGYFENDSDILNHQIANPHVKKLSWLLLSEHEEAYRYIPQLGDEVVYLRQVVYDCLVL